MKKNIVEALWTFFLVMTIGLVVPQQLELAGLVIWFVLMVMIYAGWHISWANFNPAVSFGLWVNGKLSTSELINYVISQLIGWVLWALVAYALVSQATFVAPGTNIAAWQVILAEFLFTFALVWVVLNTAVNANNWAKSFYGLAIGVTVLIWAYSVGSISGWAFNPAVAFAHQLVQSIFTESMWLSNIWMYLVWQLLGWYVAAVAYKQLAE